MTEIRNNGTTESLMETIRQVLAITNSTADQITINLDHQSVLIRHATGTVEKKRLTVSQIRYETPNDVWLGDIHRSGKWQQVIWVDDENHWEKV